MSVNALTSANGADLLQRLMQPNQQNGPAEVASTAATAVLKTAVAQAQMSEASLIEGEGPSTSGSMLNVYG